MLRGFATPEGTRAWKARFEGRFESGHFRSIDGLFLSSLGFGTYLGDPDEATDALYAAALEEALDGGINVLDTAANYRCQRSERVLGKTLAAMADAGRIRREEIYLCTKGGFLPFDGHYPEDPQAWVKQNFLETGIIKEADLVEGFHAISPAYLEYQLNASLKNLGVETVDVYYLHNPETQLGEVSVAEFKKRMQLAFAWLEEKVREGKIRSWGLATWNGFRLAETDKRYLELQTLSLWAREAAGNENHFKLIQLPVNFAMPEAWVLPNQRFGPNRVPLLNAAQRMGFTVMVSGPLMQGRLLSPLPDFIRRHFPGLEKPAQHCLQFVRSLPGVTTALAGTKNKDHVKDNLQVARVRPFKEEELLLMFSKTGMEAGS